MKKQILCCLLIATILLTGCKKDDPAIPIDPSAFVGKWVGQVIVTVGIQPPQTTMYLDTLILAINPNNSTQLINTYNLNNIIRTVVDTKNYTVGDFTVNFGADAVNVTSTQTNTKGVLTNPTTLIETGNLNIKVIGSGSGTTTINSTFVKTYTKQ